jgi:flagellar export protein FliJ
MKKYKFGLGSVLRVRRAEQDLARSRLTETQQEVDRATAQLDERLAAIGAARPDPHRTMGGAFAADREQLRRHAVAVTAARSAEANALAEMRVAREEWEAAAQRVRALERMDDRQRSTWLLDSTRAAQAATDEIAMTHARRETGR